MKPISINIPNLKKNWKKNLIPIKATSDELNMKAKLRHNVYILFT